VTNLTRASQELFRRTPDEAFASLGDIMHACIKDDDGSVDRWRPPKDLTPVVDGGRLMLVFDGDEPFALNDWSFSQLCTLSKVSKDTVNRLSPETAAYVLSETLPQGSKPAQLYTRDELVRSVHGHTYTRLRDSELVATLMEFAVDFTPPQRGGNGGTGLYRGEQDLFCFMIDPTGWIDIEGEAFAPGFFAWNSEVGRRSVGVQSFWFQAVCCNHIVWDAVDVREVTRKHTARVGEALPEIRRAVETLVARRDERRDGFASVIRRAMETRIGDDKEEAMKALTGRGIGRLLAADALEIARSQGRFTIFSVVDALTKLAGQMTNAGDRLQADQKAAELLSLA